MFKQRIQVEDEVVDELAALDLEGVGAESQVCAAAGAVAA